MNLLKCDFRILMTVVFVGLIFSSNANADNGFWISKGTATSKPSRTIRKKTITPVAKPPAKMEPVVATPVAPEAKPVVIENIPAEPDSKMASPGPAEETTAPPSDSPTNETTEPTSTDGPYVGVTFSNPVKQKWRVGVVLITGSNPAKEVYTYIPIPKDWPEQTVTTFDEDIPLNSRSRKPTNLTDSIV